MNKKYTVKEISNDTVEIEITIDKEVFKKSYNLLFNKEAEKIDLKGFRKGKVPKNVLEDKLKDSILLETFERVAPMYVSQAVQEEKIEIVAPPVYKEFPKLDTDKDLTFKVHVTVIPQFKLGNTKKIKVVYKKAEITDKEVTDVLENVVRNRKIKAKKGTDKWAVELSKIVGLPDIKNQKDLKKKVEEILLTQKENITRRNSENEALRKGIELSKISIPQPAIDYEALERENSFMNSLKEKKLTLEQFTQANNTSLEDMRKLWKKDAQEALETDIFLKLFAQERKVEVTDKELDEEIDKIKKQHEGHNHDYYNNSEWKEHIRRIQLKQKAYDQFISEVLPTKMDKESKKK